jgi:hypothetical protein
MWRRPPIPAAAVNTADKVRTVRLLVLASGFYYIVISLSRLSDFGATGPLSVWRSLQNPAAGYLNKFEVYAQGTSTSNLWLTLLLPFGVLSTALIPLIVIYWRELSGWSRLVGLAGIALHLASYLFIGTMKGIGDAVIMVAGGLLVSMSAMHRRRRTNAPRRRALIAIAGVFAVLVIFMIHNNGSRAVEFGTSDPLFQVNPAVEAAVGQVTAEGLSDVISYPTHGYLGLSYNLQTSFEWSYGLGNAPSAAIFAEQSFGIRHSTYPERTEYQRGWPAQLYWATIYPWLASDLTFPGVILFMGLVGWIVAGSWHAAVSSRRLVPTLIFGQLCILIVYVPANNQLGMTPESIVGMITLLGLYLSQSVLNRKQRDGRS